MDKDNNGKISLEKRLQALKEIFQLTDKDQDGIITADELKTVLLLFNTEPTDSEIYLILKKYDHDSSGAIDFNEFVNIMNEKISEENEIVEFINIFQGFDREGNGLLSRKTMFDVFAVTNVEVDKQLVNDMFDFIDNDKDDHITCLEFVQFWTKHGTSNN